jgi:hypothetical protein
MPNETDGFIGDLDLAKVDLEIIKRLFPEWYKKVASSKRGALRTVSTVSICIEHYCNIGLAQGTALFMGLPLLRALVKHYDLVDEAADDPALVVPSELDFTPGPQDDLESMIWVLTYAVMLHHQESLQGPAKARYKRKVVDPFYGSLSYFGLAKERNVLVWCGSNAFYDDPETWIPDPTQRKWFRRAMALVAGQLTSAPDGSTTAITFDAFDALCDEFIKNE